VDTGLLTLLAPDGNKIVFTNTQPKVRPDIYLMKADGSNETRLTHNKWIQDFSPSWFPTVTR
jgi:Tol biopolymer transport system component